MESAAHEIEGQPDIHAYNHFGGHQGFGGDDDHNAYNYEFHAVDPAAQTQHFDANLLGGEGVAPQENGPGPQEPHLETRQNLPDAQGNGKDIKLSPYLPIRAVAHASLRPPACSPPSAGNQHPSHLPDHPSHSINPTEWTEVDEKELYHLVTDTKYRKVSFFPSLSRAHTFPPALAPSNRHVYDICSLSIFPDFFPPSFLPPSPAHPHFHPQPPPYDSMYRRHWA